MTDHDPQIPQIFAYCLIALGIVQLGFGLFQKRSSERGAQMVAVVCISGAVGLFVAAAVAYFGSHIDEILSAAMGVFIVVSGTGSFLGLRRLKSGGDSGGDIVS
ncbi:MAG TPA: hypothetical protein VJS47_06960 [Rhizomicrobium sp.]|nr:hypothetical protein [Rhizomicrobium sp.]